MAVRVKQELIPGALRWFCVSSFSETGRKVNYLGKEREQIFCWLLSCKLKTSRVPVDLCILYCSIWLTLEAGMQCYTVIISEAKREREGQPWSTTRALLGGDGFFLQHALWPMQDLPPSRLENSALVRALGLCIETFPQSWCILHFFSQGLRAPANKGSTEQGQVVGSRLEEGDLSSKMWPEED